MANIHEDQMRDLVRVARHVSDWDSGFCDDVDESEVQEGSGRLHMEADGDFDSDLHWEIQEHFFENEAQEVHLAVHDEDALVVFRAVLHNCSLNEALQLVMAAAG